MKTNDEIIARLEHMLDKINRIEATVAHMKPVTVVSEGKPDQTITLDVKASRDIIERSIASIENALATIQRRADKTLDGPKRNDR
ncbi:hypothetical protein [Sphingomonas sp. R1]|uniref:hypothetical protein n=1 Tax=Sphingomonas sp. R1 TaxID=399176 RepID=UPI0022252E72|nr:hypothetical protein [Sphingomonas sp. R1]UYY77473.1 hypothetical protein OIM94_00220 [Sphingomonas sp. R1]